MMLEHPLLNYLCLYTKILHHLFSEKPYIWFFASQLIILLKFFDYNCSLSNSQKCAKLNNTHFKHFELFKMACCCKFFITCAHLTTNLYISSGQKIWALWVFPVIQTTECQKWGINFRVTVQTYSKFSIY